MFPVLYFELTTSTAICSAGDFSSVSQTGPVVGYGSHGGLACLLRLPVSRFRTTDGADTRSLVLDTRLKTPTNVYVVTEWTPVAGEKACRGVNNKTEFVEAG